MRVEIMLSPVLARRDQDLVWRKVAGNSPYEIFGRHTQMIGHAVLLVVLISFAVEIWWTRPTSFEEFGYISLAILIWCLTSLPQTLGDLWRLVRTGFVTHLATEPRIEGYNSGAATVLLTEEAVTVDAPAWRERIARPAVTGAFLHHQSLMLAAGSNHVVTLPATPQVLSFVRVSWDMEVRRVQSGRAKAG
ncbi:MAG: hypothetical protein AAGH74_17020 [Pseudomonadota bacterium]